jgi:hypothetical protein
MYYNTSTYLQGPQSSGLTTGAFNNAIAQAQASADPRFNQKEWDRPGVSRGQGTQSNAGIKAAQSLADGIADAYRIPMQSAVSEADDSLAYQQRREQLGLGASGLGMQADYAAALAALERQQREQGAPSGVLRGLGNFLGY